MREGSVEKGAPKGGSKENKSDNGGPLSVETLSSDQAGQTSDVSAARKEEKEGEEEEEGKTEEGEEGEELVNGADKEPAA